LNIGDLDALDNPTAAILFRDTEGGKSSLSLSENMESKIDGD